MSNPEMRELFLRCTGFYTQLIVLWLKQCIWSCLELIIYTFHCNNFQFNYWALCCYAYVVIFHLYLTLMFINEDGFCYFIPLNAFRNYLQQSTSPIFCTLWTSRHMEEIAGMCCCSSH